MPKASKDKSQRIYERHFSDVPVFVAKNGKYSPLPWVLRRLQWLFQPREWQILTYFIMRSGRASVCWQTDKEIAFDLGFNAKNGHKKLPAYMKSLEEHGVIRTAQAEGKRYICIVDPLTAIKTLVARGKINSERLESLNSDLELMGLDPIDAPLPASVTPLRSSVRVKKSVEQRVTA